MRRAYVHIFLLFILSVFGPVLGLGDTNLKGISIQQLLMWNLQSCSFQNAYFEEKYQMMFENSTPRKEMSFSYNKCQGN